MFSVFPYKFEYDPPGDVVITNSVTPTAKSTFDISTTMKPMKGSTMNCIPKAVKMAFLFLICFVICFMSTVADMPKTRQKRRQFPATDLRLLILLILLLRYVMLTVYVLLFNLLFSCSKEKKEK